jgi:hypothetical protein
MRGKNLTQRARRSEHRVRSAEVTEEFEDNFGWPYGQVGEREYGAASGAFGAGTVDGIAGGS